MTKITVDLEVRTARRIVGLLRWEARRCRASDAKRPFTPEPGKKNASLEKAKAYETHADYIENCLKKH